MLSYKKASPVFHCDSGPENPMRLRVYIPELDTIARLGQ
jgi:hypothetical protein